MNLNKEKVFLFLFTSDENEYQNQNVEIIFPRENIMTNCKKFHPWELNIKLVGFFLKHEKLV